MQRQQDLHCRQGGGTSGTIPGATWATAGATPHRGLLPSQALQSREQGDEPLSKHALHAVPRGRRPQPGLLVR